MRTELDTCVQQQIWNTSRSWLLAIAQSGSSHDAAILDERTRARYMF